MTAILLVDDDERNLSLSSKYLVKSGYQTLLATNGKEGIEVLEKNKNIIDLMIVDVLMPEMSGVEFCRAVRSEKKYQNIPILMLTAMSDIIDKYIGFDAGADDYLTKPFEPLELFLRVQSLLKRAGKQINDERKNDLFEITREDFSVKINDKNIYLTSIEFELLYFLYENAGHTFSSEDLLQRVLGYPPGNGNPEIIRTHIKKIRSKVQTENPNVEIIKTLPKRGYLFNKLK